MGPLWVEYACFQWILLTNGQHLEIIFLLLARIHCWTNSQAVGYPRCHDDCSCQINVTSRGSRHKFHLNPHIPLIIHNTWCFPNKVPSYGHLRIQSHPHIPSIFPINRPSAHHLPILNPHIPLTLQATQLCVSVYKHISCAGRAAVIVHCQNIDFRFQTAATAMSKPCTSLHHDLFI